MVGRLECGDLFGKLKFGHSTLTGAGVILLIWILFSLVNWKKVIRSAIITFN